ncbi:MAG: hypothetical protein AAF447_20275 [Myxococcota bacterium]
MAGEADARGTLLVQRIGSGEPMIRGTLVVSSRRVVEERGLLSAYRDRLGGQHGTELAAPGALRWYGMDVAETHYAILDALISEPNEQRAIGREVARRVQGRFLRMLVRRMAVSGLVTPARMLRAAPTLLDRGLRGVTMRIQLSGERRATVELAKLPLLRHSYCRNTFRGWFEAGLSGVCQGLRTHEAHVPYNASCRFEVAWDGPLGQP